MRRMFRRQMRKGFAPNIPPILQEANLAFDKGEYGRAAEMFEQIAERADARGGPRAPVFHLQAGRARLLAGQSTLGLPSLKRGLELFVQRRQFQRLHRAGQRVINELNEHGLNNEAAEIKAWLNDTLPTGFAIESGNTSTRRPVLPTHCSHCGAAVRPDEVEWLDDVTAECSYCGSPVREER